MSTSRSEGAVLKQKCCTNTCHLTFAIACPVTERVFHQCVWRDHVASVSDSSYCPAISPLASVWNVRRLSRPTLRRRRSQNYAWGLTKLAIATLATTSTWPICTVQSPAGPGSGVAERVFLAL